MSIAFPSMQKPITVKRQKAMGVGLNIYHMGSSMLLCIFGSFKYQTPNHTIYILLTNFSFGFLRYATPDLLLNVLTGDLSQQKLL